MKTVRSLITFLFFAEFSVLINGQDGCMTPNGVPGYCIWAEDCPPIEKILNNVQRNVATSKFVAKSFCGTAVENRNYRIKVCCDTKVAKPVCRLPNFPENGKYNIDDSEVTVGAEVKIGTILNYTCDQGYIPRPLKFSYCQNNVMWSVDTKCEKICKNLISSSIDFTCRHNDIEFSCDDLILDGTVVTLVCKPGFRPDRANNSTVMNCVNGRWDIVQPQCVNEICDNFKSYSIDRTCQLNGADVPCDGKMFSGTVVKSKCKAGYVEKSFGSLKTVKCNSGRWDNMLPRCVSECGRIKLNSNRTNYPWHADIFKEDLLDFKLVCGGAILSKRVIITSASCFVDMSLETLIDKKEYSVLIGDLNRKREEKFLRKFEIDQIRFMDKFTIKTMNENVALVILNKNIIFSINIHPVCFDNENRDLYNKHITAGSIGTARTNSSLTIEDVNMTCKIDTYEYKLNLKDKVCISYKNNTANAIFSQNIGFYVMFPAQVNNVTKYYIRGVYHSTYFEMKGYHFNYSYAFFTDLWPYRQFIEDTLLNYE